MNHLPIFLYRHAPREGSTDQITTGGKLQASALGEALRPDLPHGPCLGMCSQLLRTRETVAAILMGAGLGGAPIRQEAALSNTPFDPRWVHGESPSANTAFNVYLQFGQTRPGRQVPAPREVAARLVHLLYRQMGTAVATVVAVTHSGMIEVLLAYLLEFRRVEEIGGCFDYLEGIRLLFAQEQDASWSLRASFRGHTYSIANQILQSLLQEGSSG